MIYVAHICEGLNHFKIKKVIFPTSISHHLDTALIEIASAICNVPQVFLYCCPILPRLIPFVQHQSIADRKPLDIKFSNFYFKDAIQEFVKNKEAGKTPKSAVYYIKKRNRNPFYAFLFTYYLRLRAIASFVKHKLNKTGKSFFDIFPTYSIKEEQKLVWRQKQALEYYSSNCLGEVEIANLKKNSQYNQKPLPLIAAHFQPEATSFPEGGELFNHIDIVIKLRQVGYEGPIIYKEHFGTTLYFEKIVGMLRVGMYRSVSYYKQLSKLGCVFLPSDMNLCLDPLENFWYVPVTIGGTIGVERSLAGFSTIYTGYPWYKGMPGMVPVEKAFSFLNSSNCAGQSIDCSTETKLFLHNFLSQKTLINVLGIGTGKPILDDVSLETFQKEFEYFLQMLLKN